MPKRLLHFVDEHFLKRLYISSWNGEERFWKFTQDFIAAFGLWYLTTILFSGEMLSALRVSAIRFMICLVVVMFVIRNLKDDAD